jgi:hypothetical protein
MRPSPKTLFDLGLKAALTDCSSSEELLEKCSKAQTMFRGILYSEFSGPDDITNLMREFVSAVDDWKNGVPNALANVTVIRRQLWNLA